MLSSEVFARGTTAAWFHPYIWARFAQPTAIAFCKDEATRARVLEGLAAAVETLLSEAAPLMDAEFRGEPAAGGFSGAA